MWVLLLIAFLIVLVLAFVVVLASTLPCHRIWKENGYPTGPCTRRALHFGPHRRD